MQFLLDNPRLNERVVAADGSGIREEIPSDLSLTRATNTGLVIVAPRMIVCFCLQNETPVMGGVGVRRVSIWITIIAIIDPV